MTFFTFDTIHGIPSRALWNITPFKTPISEQYSTYSSNLRDLGSDIGAKFNSTDIYVPLPGNKPLLVEIVKTSYPLRSLEDYPKPFLVYWELSTRFIKSMLMKRVEEHLKNYQYLRHQAKTVKIQDIKISRAFVLKTFHIDFDSQDIKYNTQEVFVRIIRDIEIQTGVQIDWTLTKQCMGVSSGGISSSTKDTIDIKEQSDWIISDKIDLATTKSWHNHILTKFKSLDIITSDNDNPDKTCLILSFALQNLTTGGSTIIRLPAIIYTSILNLIHVYRMCFDEVVIHHLQADDALYLCARGYHNNLQSWTLTLLNELCDRVIENPNIGLFTIAYCSQEDFAYTAETVTNINYAVYEWRYKYYFKVVSVYNLLNKSAATTGLENYKRQILSENYKDTSKKWIKATGEIKNI